MASRSARRESIALMADDGPLELLERDDEEDGAPEWEGPGDTTGVDMVSCTRVPETNG